VDKEVNKDFEKNSKIPPIHISKEKFQHASSFRCTGVITNHETGHSSEYKIYFEIVDANYIEKENSYLVKKKTLFGSRYELITGRFTKYATVYLDTKKWIHKEEAPHIKLPKKFNEVCVWTQSYKMRNNLECLKKSDALKI
jgi:hypothetical protein